MNEERKEPVLGEVTTVAVGVFAYDLKRKARYDCNGLAVELANFLRPNFLPEEREKVAKYGETIAQAIRDMSWDNAERDKKAGKTIGELVRSVTGLALIPETLQMTNPCREITCDGCSANDGPNPDCVNEGENACRCSNEDYAKKQYDDYCRKENETPNEVDPCREAKEYLANAHREYTHPGQPNVPAPGAEEGAGNDD